MIRRLLLLVLVLACSVPVFAQAPNIDFGSIVTMMYQDGQGEASPLRVNDGDATFTAGWTILLAVEISDHLAFYSETQTVNGWEFVNYGLSGIYTPDPEKPLHIEFGKFIAPFGNFLPRRWASENPLTSTPLLYDYQTTLSSSLLMEDESQLLAARGTGNGIMYDPDGINYGSGLRILSRGVYATGAQVFGQYKKLSFNFGLANGALSNPADINNTNAVQVLSRVVVAPIWGLYLGASFADGHYLNKDAVAERLTAAGLKAERFHQRTFGFDAAYSIGHLEFYGEALFNRWQTPFVADDLDAIGMSAEIKYGFLTRFYLAGRFSSIDFQDIDDPEDVDGDGRLHESWDYDVRQLELGLGYSFSRNGVLKLMHVSNMTRGSQAGDPDDDVFLAQVALSF